MTAIPVRLDRRVVLITVALALIVGLLLFLAPDAMAASDNVGKNFGDLLQKYAAQFYLGLIAIVSLIFLVNKAYSQLGVFLIAAVVVGMLVVTPDNFLDLAKSTSNSLFK